jgi:hypothetical protein
MTSAVETCASGVRLGGKAAALVCLLLATAPLPAAVADQPFSGAVTAADMAGLQRKAYEAAVVQAMRVKRFASIGQLCRLLSAEDAAIIVRNADAMIEDERALLAPGDSAWARAYRDGVGAGAFQSASPLDVKDDEACRRFAAPGGVLAKIRTWTGKRVEEGGIILSPRTMP